MTADEHTLQAPDFPKVPKSRTPGHTYRSGHTEAERLAALTALGVLDTPEEQVFDDLVGIASIIAGVPTSLVSLVDRDRQWFKAKVGMDPCSTGRDVAFCDHVVRAEAELEVPDARTDPRFHENPLVTGEPHIVFYAGFPLLMTDGTVPGTLCVIGYEPNRLSPEQKVALRALARQVVTQLELRVRTADQAREIERREVAEANLAASRLDFQQLAETSADIVCRYGLDGRIDYINGAVTSILGHRIDQMLGEYAQGFVHPEHQAEFDAARDAAARGDRRVVTAPAQAADSSWRWLEITFTPVRNGDGEIFQVQSNARDVDQRVRATDRLISSEQRFRSVYEDSPVGIVLADQDGIVKEVNPAMTRLLELPEEQIIGRRRDSFAPAGDPEPGPATWFRANARPGDVVEMERRYVRADGAVRWSWVTVACVEGPDGTGWSLAHVMDITARKAAERALADSEANLSAIGQVVRRIQSGEDPRETIVTALREIGGTHSANLIELAPDGDSLVITASSHPGYVGTAVSTDDDTAITLRVWESGEGEFVPDVHQHPTLRHRVAGLSDVHGMMWQPVVSHGFVRAILTVTWKEALDDISARAARAVLLLADEAAVALEHDALLRRYEELATTDQLTGLPNRRAWDDRLTVLLALSSRTQSPLCVAVADVDHFKRYNDTHGHLEGDVLLGDLATAFRDQLRVEDVVARWGGEEFAIALPGAAADDAISLLERVRAATPRGQTVSVGVAQWKPGATAESLLAAADAALYRAKAGGRDRVVVATDDETSAKTPADRDV